MNFVKDIQQSQIKTICDIVWGKSTKGMSFFNKCWSKLSTWMLGSETPNIPVWNLKIISERLANIGYSQEQIYEIRDVCVESMLAAQTWIANKHNIGPKYLGQNSQSFGVYQLYLNVSNDILNEFGTLAYNLFQKKLTRLKYFKEF